MRIRLVALIATALLVSAGLGSCSSEPGGGRVTDDDAITVASFNFPESELVAELYAGALESAGFRVIRQTQVGSRELVLPSLQRGLIEVVPEYAGSALTFLGGQASPDTDETHNLLTAAVSGRGLAVLPPSPAQSRNGLVVSAETADRLNLERISDLAQVDHAMVIGGPPECLERDLCLPGLEETYGLSFDSFLALDAGGLLAAEALERGTVDVAVIFTTAGELSDGDLVMLRDDRQLQPAENLTPLVRQDMLSRFGPRVRTTLEQVSEELTTQDLRELNAEVASGAAVADVARVWLAEHGAASAQE